MVVGFFLCDFGILFVVYGGQLLCGRGLGVDWTGWLLCGCGYWDLLWT